MSRFVPLTHRDGTKLAIDAHAVKDIVEMPDGLVRLWVGDEFRYEIPGTVAQIAALLSDPPAGAVRFVEIDGEFFNPATVCLVTFVLGEEDRSAVYVVGREFPSYVDMPYADVIAKLEGRAL